jgi:5-methylcytosine-specific restriction endonuclease McrA
MDPPWAPIEGVPKKRRPNTIRTKFSKKRANHRNAILKDWAERLEPLIEPKVPADYVSPFDKKKCVYCLSTDIGPSGDEFRPSTQRGRQNKVNCVPCCGACNSSKQDICGSKLIEWIRGRSNAEQQDIIIKWYQENEKYLLIPPDTIDPKHQKPYSTMEMELDEQLNEMFERFS